MLKHFHHSRRESMPIGVAPHYPQNSQPKAVTSIFYLLPIRLFWTFHISRIYSMWFFVTAFFHLEHFKVYPCYSMCQNLMPFFGWIILHYVGIIHFAYPLSVDGHSSYFHFLTIKSKSQNGCKHLCIFSVNISFQFFWVYNQEWNC